MQSLLLYQPMSYPLLSEYVEAIRSAEDNLKELSYLRPVLGDDGLPVMTSGNFAVVFKMKDEQSGNLYALKCFTKEQEGRADAYREIAKELKDVSSPYLVSIQYWEKELFVDSNQVAETEFPVLLMDWVEGKTLDKYLRENLEDKYALEMLAYRFSQLAQWLLPQPFAHGDLKPDNILVREDGTLALVDYDGMYVPTMKGQKARELGSPDFRHPLRTENDFDEHIDDFPLVSILLSLKAISLNPQLLEEYGAPDRLLFSERDYRSIIQDKHVNKCVILKNETFFIYSETFDGLIWLFRKILNSPKEQIVLFHLQIDVPTSRWNRVTSISKVEREKGISYIDIGEAKYTEDETKIISFYDMICGSYLGDVYEDPFWEYSIKPTTITICDKAFANCHTLRFLSIPNSVKYVGQGAFYGCYMRYIELPLVEYINKNAFESCPYLHTIAIPPGSFLFFSKMLPKNVYQLKEINASTCQNSIKSYLLSDKKRRPYDLMTSLFCSISHLCFIKGHSKITYNFHLCEDNSCCGFIEDDSPDHAQFHIENVEDIDVLATSMYYLLLDSGMLNSYNPYQYVVWNFVHNISDVPFLN